MCCKLEMCIQDGGVTIFSDAGKDIRVKIAIMLRVFVNLITFC